jgi:crotonobetainyl-CoA:carnitine CoA-transferase CaiB-like acyl-CoA transferase
MYEEPQLAAREYFHELEHAVCGRLRFPGWPMRFSFLPVPPYAAPAPTLGEHNAEVLRSALGLSPDEIATLRAGRIVSDTIENL